MRALAASFDRLADPVTLVLDVEAKTKLRAWMTEIEPRRRPDADLGHIQGWSSKLDGAVVRVAGLLHLADNFATGFGRPIAAPTMANAIAIGRYLIEHALAAYDEMGGDPSLEGARRVLRWIRRTDVTTFTKRECHVAHRSRFPRASDLDPILGLLIDSGFIREAVVDRPFGRPSRRFEVNPLSQTQKAQ
jgi:hypothetical protein